MKSTTLAVCAFSVALFGISCAGEMDPFAVEAAVTAHDSTLDEGFCSSLCEAILQCEDGVFMSNFARVRARLSGAASSFADCMTLCELGAVAPSGYAAGCMESGGPATECLFVADVMETAELCDSLDANWALDWAQ